MNVANAASLGLEVATATDPGRDPMKQVNEDTAAARHTAHGHLAVVCDGMGGHVGGREASRIAVETIFRVFDATPAGAQPSLVLADAIREANRAVFARGQEHAELKGMGSTAVAVLTHAGGSEVAHVGDSRVYLLTQGQIYQVTKDHSLVQRLVDANMLTPEQASNHPNANQITNALGQKPTVEVELRPQPFPIVPGDVFLLCSDGLSDECGPQDFLQTLAPMPPLAEAARQLIELANARGGHDNVTLVLVRVPGGAPFSYRANAHTPVETQAATGALAAVVEPTLAGLPSGTPATQEMTLAGSAPAAANVAPMPAGTVAQAPAAPPSFRPPPAYRPGAGDHAHDDEGRRRSPWVIFVVLFVLLAAGAGAAWWWINDKPSVDKASAAHPSASEPEPEDSATAKPTKAAPKALTPPPDESEPSPPTPQPPANAGKSSSSKPKRTPAAGGSTPSPTTPLVHDPPTSAPKGEPTTKMP